MKIITDPKFDIVLSEYPDHIKDKMQYLRELVRETAIETGEIKVLEETLKWSEPSFVTKTGSTLRMDWKKKNPEQYAMYFKCTSKLVDTIRLVFENKFKYEGKRAIVFNLNQEIPISELEECIKATLLYHKVKNLKSLGMNNSF